MTTQIKHPLNAPATKAADDAFYTRHPEMVTDGKRQSIDPNDPAQGRLREEWRQLYDDNGGAVETTPRSEQNARGNSAKHADNKAKDKFQPVPAGSAVLPCGAKASTAVAQETTKPAPVASSTKACKEGGQACKVNKTTVSCQHGARGGKLGPGNVLQVVPEGEISTDTINLIADVATCGKVVEWTVSGATEDTAHTNSYKLSVRGWPYRAVMGASPLSRWAARAVPHVYRIRGKLECGSFGDSYTIEAYPSDKIKTKIEPAEQPLFEGLKTTIVGFLKRVLGSKFEAECLMGSLSLEAYWKEHDASWQAFYAYDIIIGFNPLVKVEYRVPILKVLSPMVSVPPAAIDWLTEYVGDALYFAASGQMTADGRLTRTAPDVFTNWYFQLGGGVGIEIGFEIKAANTKSLKLTAKGASGLSVTAQAGPKEKESWPTVRVDGKFDGLKGSVELVVANGWYKFEEEYMFISEKVLFSNWQPTVFNES